MCIKRNIFTFLKSKIFKHFRDIARLGDLDLNSNVPDGANPIDIPVSRIIVHENYISRTMMNDIALLKLENNVRFNSKLFFN